MLSSLKLRSELIFELTARREELEKQKLLKSLLDDSDLLDALHRTPNDVLIIHEVGRRIKKNALTVADAVDTLPSNTDVPKFLGRLLENVEIAQDILAYTRQVQTKDEMLTRVLVEILLNTEKFDERQAFSCLKEEGFLPNVLVVSWCLVNSKEIDDFLDIAAKELTVDTIADIALTLNIIQLPVVTLWLTHNGFLWATVYDSLDKATLGVIINNQV